MSSSFNILSLDGCHLPGLVAYGLKVKGNVFMRNIVTTGPIELLGTKIGGQLDLEHSKLDGAGEMAFQAQGLETGENLYLRDLTATGTINVNGAKIGGQIDCTGATLNGAGGKAFSGQSVRCGQSLHFNKLNATGTVDLLGANVAGRIDFEEASLNGAGDSALIGQGMIASRGFLFRKLRTVTGRINLAASHVSDLVDDMESWPIGLDDMVLDGFTYDRMYGPVTLAARRDWLAIGSSLKGDFFPQPYTQFARTLRSMGHPVEARRVMIEANVQRALRDRATLRAQRKYQRQLRLLSRTSGDDVWDQFLELDKTMPAPARDWAEAVWTRFDNIHRQLTDLPKAPPPLPEMTFSHARKGFQNEMASGALWCQVKRVWNKLRNGFLRWTVGYGYSPQNSVAVLAALILGATLLAQAAWNEGSFAPNSDVILTSPEWTNIAAQGCVLADAAECLPNPAATWSAKNAPGMDWDSFNALAYAADLVVPLIDLGQTRAWAPSKDRGPWGQLMWWGRWVFIIAGWVVASLGLAAVTGFVQKNAPD